MKPRLIVLAAVIAIVAALVVTTKLTHFGQRHERAGNFDVYATAKFPDSSVSSSLYYHRRQLTSYLTGYAVDPNNADRIVFSSDDKYHGAKSVCGTFLYDGKTNASVVLRDRPYASGNAKSWSPDGRYLLIDQTTVRDVQTGQETDLANFVAKKDGQRTDPAVIEWSPDGSKLAARLGATTEGGNRDEDLIEVTVSPVSFRYVATIRNSSLVWTDEQIQWSNGGLQVKIPAPRDRTILLKPAEELAWVAGAPRTPPQRSVHEGYCSTLESKN